MNMQIRDFSVEIRPSNKPGLVKAYADVTIQTSEGRLRVLGHPVIQKDGGSPFIGFPSRQGNMPGKYFPIVEAEGDIRKEIFDAILAAYRKMKKPL
jgi:DNA-binding cell septation regulator SpoVG